MNPSCFDVIFCFYFNFVVLKQKLGGGVVTLFYRDQYVLLYVDLPASAIVWLFWADWMD